MKEYLAEIRRCVEHPDVVHVIHASFRKNVVAQFEPPHRVRVGRLVALTRRHIPISAVWAFKWETIRCTIITIPKTEKNDFEKLVRQQKMFLGDGVPVILDNSTGQKKWFPLTAGNVYTLHNGNHSLPQPNTTAEG